MRAYRILFNFSANNLLFLVHDADSTRIGNRHVAICNRIFALMYIHYAACAIDSYAYYGTRTVMYSDSKFCTIIYITNLSKCAKIVRIQLIEKNVSTHIRNIVGFYIARDLQMPKCLFLDK
jgi:hypothetical protein